MEIFKIKKSEEGKRLDQFLMEQKHWPRAFFMKALRTKKIKVNGRKEEAAFRLSAGDEVRSFVLEKRDAVRAVRILYEDENLLVVYKPAGILTLDITGKEKDTMPPGRRIRQCFSRAVPGVPAFQRLRKSSCNRNAVYAAVPYCSHLLYAYCNTTMFHFQVHFT